MSPGSMIMPFPFPNLCQLIMLTFKRPPYVMTPSRLLWIGVPIRNMKELATLDRIKLRVKGSCTISCIYIAVGDGSFQGDVIQIRPEGDREILDYRETIVDELR